MRRSPATIVILAWNAWESTRACLESLRPTLGVSDQVVVVDNGSTDETPTRLRAYPWLQVVTNPENRGFAGGCNDGAAAARHDAIVFLNNDTVLSGHWLDPLVAPFDDDPQVAATGPCSNWVTGPQIAEGASYLSDDRAAMRRFARTWAQEHRGLRSEVSRLVGFCIALRRSVFEELGGFDESYGLGGFEDDDLCRRIAAAGHKLLITHESFVHHVGHQTFKANELDWVAEQESNRSRFEERFGSGNSSHDYPLVSACLITKDEEANLATCLGSVDGFVDEVVVYDTGSTDRTVALARELGATVIEGYWDDDFARARNESLAHCRGEWVLWIDADETLECEDPAELRRALLYTDPRYDGFSVRIHNLTGAGVGAGFVHSACRLFRRSVCEWIGRLHEQVAGRGDGRGIRQFDLADATIRHTGYLDEAMESRHKTERNLRVAQAEVDKADGWERGFSLTSLGRSYLTAGRFEEGVAACTEALEHTTNPITRRLALRTIAEAQRGMGRFEEAMAATQRLRDEGGELQADVTEAQIRLALGEHERCLELLDHVVARRSDNDGFHHDEQMYAKVRAEALVGLGRVGDAADVLLSGMSDFGVLDTHLGTLIELLERARRPLTDLAAAIPVERAPMFLAQALQLQPAKADALLEAYFDHMADRTAVLATAASLAKRLPVERALEWSARIRAAGYASSCPLIALAQEPGPAVERARAAAVAFGAFGDERGRAAFLVAAREADAGELQVIRDEVGMLSPVLAPLVPDHPLPGRENRPGSPLGPINAPAGEAANGTAQDAAPRTGQPRAATSRVSVVIPCRDKAELTVACLQSLAGTTARDQLEVILVDNGSTDATRELAGLQDDRFVVLRNEENTGFGPACNQGAAAAKGEFVLFLNNDTVLQPGWLEPLLAAMDEDPRLGAVQPKLLYPDGRLNDAGGLVFGGGEPWIYGKGHPNPDAPPFACRRAPDYASGACLLVRRSAFEEVGGFDYRYAPAYYEDTDLSFALRAAGWRVLYEPASTVVHVEGGTAGTDVTKGLKRYQVENAAKFQEKWAAELATRMPLDPKKVDDWAHRPQGGFGPGETPVDAEPAQRWETARAAAADARSILVLDPSMPVFDRASGSLRLFTLLHLLREHGDAVTFFAVGGGSRRYADLVGKAGICCYGLDPAADRAFDSDFAPRLEQLVKSRRFDVVVISPWDLGEKALEIVRRHAPRALVILDTNDVHFRRLERASELSDDPAERTRVAGLRDRELAVYRKVDRVLCVTEQDAEAVRREIHDVDALVVPNVHAEVDPGPGFDARDGSVFVGNFNHPPNADAMVWWAEEIDRPVRARLEHHVLQVVGNDPRGFAASIARDGIVGVGTVESTLPYLHRAKVSVAPLRYGAGMKGKVGEALAAGTPVVATSVAAEGMDLVDGEHLLVADTPEAFAAAVQRLHDDAALWERLRDNGRAHVAEHFGLERMRRELDTLLAPARVTAR